MICKHHLKRWVISNIQCGGKSLYIKNIYSRYDGNSSSYQDFAVALGQIIKDIFGRKSSHVKHVRYYRGLQFIREQVAKDVSVNMSSNEAGLLTSLVHGKTADAEPKDTSYLSPKLPSVKNQQVNDSVMEKEDEISIAKILNFFSIPKTQVIPSATKINISLPQQKSCLVTPTSQLYTCNRPEQETRTAENSSCKESIIENNTESDGIINLVSPSSSSLLSPQVTPAATVIDTAIDEFDNKKIKIEPIVIDDNNEIEAVKTSVLSAVKSALTPIFQQSANTNDINPNNHDIEKYIELTEQTLATLKKNSQQISEKKKIDGDNAIEISSKSNSSSNPPVSTVTIKDEPIEYIGTNNQNTSEPTLPSPQTSNSSVSVSLTQSIIKIPTTTLSQITIPVSSSITSMNTNQINLVKEASSFHSNSNLFVPKELLEMTSNNNNELDVPRTKYSLRKRKAPILIDSNSVDDGDENNDNMQTQSKQSISTPRYLNSSLFVCPSVRPFVCSSVRLLPTFLDSSNDDTCDFAIGGPPPKRKRKKKKKITFPVKRKKKSKAQPTQIRNNFEMNLNMNPGIGNNIMNGPTESQQQHLGGNALGLNLMRSPPNQNSKMSQMSRRTNNDSSVQVSGRKKVLTLKLANKIKAVSKDELSMMTVEDRERPYDCQICGKRYKNQQGLRYHYKHKHDTEDASSNAAPSTPLAQPTPSTQPTPQCGLEAETISISIEQPPLDHVTGEKRKKGTLRENKNKKMRIKKVVPLKN